MLKKTLEFIVTLTVFKAFPLNAEYQTIPRLLEGEENQLIELKLINLQNIYYSARIRLGIKSDEFNLIIDTGSNTIWVPGQDCNTCQQQGLRKKLDCNEEKTCQKTNINQELDYGVGVVKGNIVNTQVQLGQSMVQLNILSINQIEQLPDFMGNGLIGLGKKNSQETQSFVELLYYGKIIPKPEFSLLLSGQTCKEDSLLTLGGRSQVHAGKQYVAKSDNPEFWSVQFENIILTTNNNTIEFSSQKINQLLIDSGTTKITFPKEVMEQLIMKFNDDLGIACQLENFRSVLPYLDCRKKEIYEYPKLEFKLKSLNNEMFYIGLAPEDYVDDCYYSFFQFGMRCRMKILQMDGPEIILGVVFMQKYYTTFNYEQQSIGFQKLEELRNQPILSEYVKKHYQTQIDLIFLFIFVICIIVLLYGVGRVIINSKMDIYVSVLEKSSSRSDREQELSNLNKKQQSSIPTSPGEGGLRQEYPDDKQQLQQ